MHITSFFVECYVMLMLMPITCMGSYILKVNAMIFENI